MAIGTPRAGAISVYGASGTTSTVQYPAGVAAGEFLLIAIPARTNQSFSASGWTHVAAQSGTYTRFTYLWKIADAGDVGASTVTVSGPAVLRTMKMLAVPGVDPASPIAGTSSYSGDDGAVTTTTMPGLTPPVAGCMPVWGATGFLGAGATYTPTWNNGQLNPPGTTEWLDTWQEVSGSNGRAGCSYWQTPLADTTTTGTRGAEATTAATSSGHVFPAAAGARGR